MLSANRRLFSINGKNILIRGGGWSPDMMLREDPQRLRDEFRYVQDMGLNTIRLEGKLETKEFFDLADERGILLIAGWCCCDHWEHWPNWKPQDFTIAEQSLRDQMYRLRGHPSLIAWMNGSDNPPPPDVEQTYLKVEKELLWTNPVVSSATAKLAGFSGESGVKMTGPYEYVAPSYWQTDKIDSRTAQCNQGGCGGAYGFNTETSMGPAVPPIESIRAMVGKDHLWPIDDTWNYHAGGGAFKDIHVFTDALNARFGPATSAEDYAVKVAAADLRRRARHVRGLQPQQVHLHRRDPVDAEQRLALDDLAPLRLLPAPGRRLFRRQEGDGVAASGVWLRRPLGLAGQQPVRGRQRVEAHRQGSQPRHDREVFQGSLARCRRRQHQQDPDSARHRRPEPDVFPGPAAAGFLRQTGGSNFYWLSTKPETLDWEKSNWYTTPTSSYADYTALSQLPKVKLKVTDHTERKGEEAITHVTLENPSKSLAFFVRLKVNKGKGGDEILPVVWQDNYISLLPGEKREVTATYRAQELGTAQPAVEVSGWNVE